MPRVQIKALSSSSRITFSVSRVVGVLFALITRQRSRATLGKLDSHLLRDIGVDPKTAAKEAAKLFWQP